MRSFMQYQDFKVDFSNVLVIYINQARIQKFLRKRRYFCGITANFWYFGGGIFQLFSEISLKLYVECKI